MEEKDNKKNKKRLRDLIFEIILIIIIILLLLHSCGLKKRADKYKNQKTPTNNIDVIEIKCDDSSKCSKDTNKDDNSDSKESNGSKKSGTARPTIGPANSSDNKEDTDGIEELVVEDNEKDYVHWNGSDDLKIFSNPAYEYKEKIAPESSNSYKFIVRNKSNYKLKYKITFVETNPFNINLKYKLKKNGNYIVNSYVSYNGVDIKDQVIDANKEDVYYLDWKWISSDNDTQIGKIQADYKLKIEIEAESINE